MMNMITKMNLAIFTVALLLAGPWPFAVYGFSIGRGSSRMPPKYPTASSSSSGLPIVVPTAKEDVLLWTHDIDEDAKAQFIRVAESGIATGPVAGMPDAHLGKGVTIGTVFASDRYVCPNAVGVDIGCGMAAVPIEGLYKDDLSLEMKQDIHTLIKEKIPTGFEMYKSSLPETKNVLDKLVSEVGPTKTLLDMLFDENDGRDSRAQRQLGTLGGGNHFIEVVYCTSTEQVWVMLHSGSRGIGNKIATHYNDVARQWLLESRHLSEYQIKKLSGLHYMEIDSPQGQAYLTDMEFCQRYAYENRSLMLKTVLNIVKEKTGKSADLDHAVNIHHNYCVLEEIVENDIIEEEEEEEEEDQASSSSLSSTKVNQNRRKLWVTRKGATSAKEGEFGIIPGSMGVGSYITRGLGNAQSWCSSSHGAGRTMSRTQARERISQSEFEKSMEGIVCETDSNVRDEAPQAYKDLTQVMNDQSTLTEIVHHLLPLINVKGIEPSKNKVMTKEERRTRLEREKQLYIDNLNKPKNQNKKGYRERVEKRLRLVEERLVSLDE